MKILINKRTIRKNPEAFKSIENIFTNWECTFDIIGNGKIPKFLKENENFVISSSKITESSFIVRHCHLIDLDIRDLLINAIQKRKSGIRNFSEKFNTIQVHHFPLPEYLYEYENPFLQCNNCKQEILNNEIIRDWEDDQYEYEECPKCKARNSFERVEYETINEALKL